MFKKLFDNLFGPLNEGYCYYFLFLSVISFISLLLIVLKILFHLLNFKTKTSSTQYFALIGGALAYFIIYFVNRLLFTMCKDKVVHK